MEASRGRLMAIIKTQSEIAASDLDTDQVMHLTAKRAQEITDATSAVIELPEGEEMVYAVTSGEATPYLGIRMDRRSTLSGLALDRDQVLYCEDTEIDPRVDRRASRRVNLRSMICVPLKHQGKAVGVLKVYSPKPRHFGARRRRDAQPAERRDLGPSGPRLPVRARRPGGPDGRAHRPLQPPGIRGAAGGRGRTERPLRSSARPLPLRPRRVQGRQRPLRAPGRRRGASRASRR